LYRSDGRNGNFSLPSLPRLTVRFRQRDAVTPAFQTGTVLDLSGREQFSHFLSGGYTLGRRHVFGGHSTIAGGVAKLCRVDHDDEYAADVRR
jgi:hypothetical protein